MRAAQLVGDCSASDWLVRADTELFLRAAGQRCFEFPSGRSRSGRAAQNQTVEPCHACWRAGSSRPSSDVCRAVPTGARPGVSWMPRQLTHRLFMAGHACQTKSLRLPGGFRLEPDGGDRHRPGTCEFEGEEACPAPCFMWMNAAIARIAYRQHSTRSIALTSTLEEIWRQIARRYSRIHGHSDGRARNAPRLRHERRKDLRVNKPAALCDNPAPGGRLCG